MKFKWNVDAFEEVRSSPAAQRLVEGEAEQIAAECGDGYEVRGPEVSGGRVRARAAVITAGAKAAAHEAKHHTLAGKA